jgi:serine/threonine protein kinase
MITFENPKAGDQGEILDLSNALGFGSSIFTVKAVYKGGMGVCLRVSHKESQCDFAIKSIFPEKISSSCSWDRFIEELKVWITLSECDGVAEALHIIKINEVPCMIATWMDGGNLRRFIYKSQPMFVYTTILRIVRTLEWALAKHNVMHRDVKPENILLDQNGRAFVADWGLARFLKMNSQPIRPSCELDLTRAVVNSSLTQEGDFVGTVLYASPEQILGSPSIDHRSDIYSLGCMLFEWETGTTPFQGDIPQYVAYQHIHEPPPATHELKATSNFGLENIIYRCLEKSPSDRYQDYNSLSDDILKVAHGYCPSISDYVPSLRYRRVSLKKRDFEVEYITKVNTKGFGLISFSEMNPFIHKASSLVSLGKFKEASEVLLPFFISEIARNLLIWNDYIHGIAVKLGLCLSSSNSDQTSAIEIFETLAQVEPKSAEYFINYSLALIRSTSISSFKAVQVDLVAESQRVSEVLSRAENIVSDGLARFPDDRDMLGNLSIIQQTRGDIDGALQTSLKRLTFCRDIHALEESASLLRKIAEQDDEDWPKATAYWNAAVDLLNEARNLNPRFITVRISLMQILHKLYRFGDARDEVEAVFEFSNDRPSKELAIATQASLLESTQSYPECIDFCNKWLPLIENDYLKFSIRRTRSKVLADHYCIGLENDTSRVINPDIVVFFVEAVNSKIFGTTDDFVYLARLQDWLCDYHAAEIWFSQAETRDSNYWLVPYEKAMFLFRLERMQEAFEEIGRCIQIAPFRPEPLDRLANMNELLGNIDEALLAKAKADKIFDERLSLAKNLKAQTDQ